MGDVRVGQTWESVDRRRPGRMLRVVQIVDQKAACVDTVTGKRADIKLSRLNPHGGYRLAIDPETPKVPACTSHEKPCVPGAEKAV